MCQRHQPSDRAGQRGIVLASRRRPHLQIDLLRDVLGQCRVSHDPSRQPEHPRTGQVIELGERVPVPFPDGSHPIGEFRDLRVVPRARIGHRARRRVVPVGSARGIHNGIVHTHTMRRVSPMVATVENYMPDIVAVEFGSGQPVKAGHLGEYSQIPRSQRGPRVRQQPADPLPAGIQRPHPLQITAIRRTPDPSNAGFTPKVRSRRRCGSVGRGSCRWHEHRVDQVHGGVLGLHPVRSDAGNGLVQIRCNPLSACPHSRSDDVRAG